MPGQAAQAAQAAQASSGCCACLHSALNALRSACSTRGEHHWKALAACTQGDYLQPAVRRLKPYWATGSRGLKQAWRTE